MRAFVYVALVAAVAAKVVFSKPNNPAAVSSPVLKCCKHGEKLFPVSDSKVLPRCQPSSDKWGPIIYSPTMQNFLQDIPLDWHVVDGVQPKCADDKELVHVPFRHGSFFLFDNGNVILEMGSNVYFPPGQYCVENNDLLVCVQKKASNHAAATMRPRVRRCCGENATFHEHG